MAKARGPYSGKWWRHESYEIRAGYIVPSDDAECCAYDPWELHHVARTPGTDLRSPAAQLLRIAGKLNFEQRAQSGGGTTFVIEGEEELLDFCSRYGLLGILPHEAVSVTPAPPAMYAARSHELIVANPTWHRVGGTWTGFPAIERYTEEDAPGLAERLIDEGILLEHVADDPLFGGFGPFGDVDVDPDSLATKGWPVSFFIEEVTHETRGDGVPPALLIDTPKGWPEGWAPPGVMRLAAADERDIFRPDRGMPHAGWMHEPITRTWTSYFPSIPPTQDENYIFPRPLSRQFWQVYAEPVESFIRTARLLEMGTDDFSLLNRLTPTAGVALTEGDEGLREEWTFSSLISALAMMIMDDLTGPMRLRRCERCHAPYFSKAREAKYCSDTCRSTAAMKRWREKKRRRRQQGRQGGTG